MVVVVPPLFPHGATGPTTLLHCRPFFKAVDASTVANRWRDTTREGVAGEGVCSDDEGVKGMRLVRRRRKREERDALEERENFRRLSHVCSNLGRSEWM